MFGGYCLMRLNTPKIAVEAHVELATVRVMDALA